MTMQTALVAAALLVAGWTEAPPPTGATPPPQGQYQYRVLPPPQQPYRPQPPLGPAQGSIERCLRIQSGGGLSC
jgi:hypothetical protein